MMKENIAIEKLITNVYLRNIVLLSILFSATIARKVYQAGSFNFKGFCYSGVVFTVLYLIVFFHNTILYPRLWRRKQYFLYVVTLLSVWVAYNELFLPFSKELFSIIDTMSQTLTDKVLIIYGFLINTYIGLAFYQGFNYFKEREDSLRLAYLKRELELKQLKEQLHPHFLFNALNNIYSYSIENNVRANELILKLSELMRFTIEHASKDSIAINDEVQFIEHYIAFEKERLGKRCSVSFVKDIVTDNVVVAPFILFTLIENAFKHGTVTVRESHIDINLSVSDDRISLNITNPMHRNIQYSTKTGVANVRRRLSIIYPQKHTLKLMEDGEVFKTELSIDVA